MSIMHISNPNSINLSQTKIVQQADKTNLQEEIKCFEAYLISELTNNPFPSEENTLSNLLTTNNNIQLMNNLGQLFNNQTRNTTLGNAVNSIALKNRSGASQVYTQNQALYSNAAAGDYHKIFKSDVFLGDSITKGLSAYGFLDNSKVCAEVGIGTDQVKNRVDTAAKQNPQRVFVLCGVNDLGRYSKDQFARHYTELIEEVKAKCPNAKVYVQPILPVLSQAASNNPSINNERISEFNSIISQISKAENVGFINSSVLVNNNQNFYAPDGIHYKPSFYTSWLNFLQKNAV